MVFTAASTAVLLNPSFSSLCRGGKGGAGQRAGVWCGVRGVFCCSVRIRVNHTGVCGGGRLIFAIQGIGPKPRQLPAKQSQTVLLLAAVET